MLIHKEKLTGTPSSGTLTKTTSKFSGVMLKYIHIVPATATTTYNLTIKDKDSDTIFSETAIEGTFRRELDLPIFGGNQTVEITSASVDEAFTLILGVLEKP